jgi:hypothetical protein
LNHSCCQHVSKSYRPEDDVAHHTWSSSGKIRCEYQCWTFEDTVVTHNPFLVGSPMCTGAANDRDFFNTSGRGVVRPIVSFFRARSEMLPLPFARVLTPVRQSRGFYGGPFRLAARSPAPKCTGTLESRVGCLAHPWQAETEPKAS